MEISSRKNPEIKNISLLKDKKHRDNCGLYLIEGEKLVKEAVKFGVSIVKIVGTSLAVLPYKNLGFDVLEVTKDIADYLSDQVTPQGILAIAKKPDNRLIAPLFNSILLDTVQDPGNVGTIIRTAVAVGIKDIYMVNCADAYSPKTVRASMSGIFNVNIHTGTYLEVLSALKDTPIICGDLNGENVFTFTPPKKFCLAIGSEGQGLSSEVKKSATKTVKIPMSDKMESLNAGVSCSILLYQLTFNQKGE